MLREQRADEVRTIVARYPEKRSAILPLLEMAQAVEGYVSGPAMEEIGDILGLTPSYVHSVATFYTMLHMSPVGKRRLYICQTLACALAGAEELVAACEKRLGIEVGQTTADGKTSLFTMECLGSCGTAPVVMVDNQRYYESVDVKKLNELIEQPFEDEADAARQAATRKGGE